MHRRVRLLYLEFLYLVPQLNGFYTPRGAASTPQSDSTSTTLPPPPPRPFFLRVSQDHPVCTPLRRLSAIEFKTNPHSQGDVTDTVVVFKLQKHEELQVLDVYMPRNWRNDRKLHSSGNALSRSSSSSASPSAPLSPPSAEAEYRAHVQRLFYANALVPAESAEWKRCLARGRYELRGIQNVLHVRKYRALYKRYGWASQLSRTELAAVWAGDMAQVEQALLGLSNKDVYGYAAEEEAEEDTAGSSDKLTATEN